EDVAALVAEVTDDKSLPKAMRKQKQVETASTKTRWAKVLRLADKTSNLRAVATAPPEDWSVKRRLEYIQWSKRVLQGLRGVNPMLEELCDEAADAAKRSLRPAL